MTWATGSNAPDRGEELQEVDPAPKSRSKAKVSTPPVGHDPYVVQKGDTVAKIALKHNMTVSALKQSSRLVTNTVFPGQIVFVKQSALPVSGNSAPPVLDSHLTVAPHSFPASPGSSSSPNKSLGLDGDGDLEPLSPTASPDYARISNFSGFYCDSVEEIFGQLTLVDKRLIFSPHLQHPAVEMRGMLPYQADIDLALMKTLKSGMKWLKYYGPVLQRVPKDHGGGRESNRPSSLLPPMRRPKLSPAAAEEKEKEKEKDMYDNMPTMKSIAAMDRHLSRVEYGLRGVAVSGRGASSDRASDPAPDPQRRSSDGDREEYERKLTSFDTIELPPELAAKKQHYSFVILEMDATVDRDGSGLIRVRKDRKDVYMFALKDEDAAMLSHLLAMRLLVPEPDLKEEAAPNSDAMDDYNSADLVDAIRRAVESSLTPDLEDAQLVYTPPEEEEEEGNKAAALTEQLQRNAIDVEVVESDYSREPSESESQGFEVIPRQSRTVSLDHARILGSSHILNAHYFDAILEHIPARLQRTNLVLLYSTAVHGVSLRTFYNNTEKNGPTMLLVKDTRHRIFGGIAMESWHLSSEHYYGTGESFLFAFKKPVDPQNPQEHQRNRLAVYPWTTADDYFQSGRDDGIILGGGTQFGLYLDADFLEGHTGSCSTFGNQPLTGTEEEDFVCQVFECWGFESEISFVPHRLGEDSSSRLFGTTPPVRSFRGRGRS
jgi:LysM repeat protein